MARRESEATPPNWLPPVQASVELAYRPVGSTEPYRYYLTRIIGRAAEHDFLDAPRAASGNVVSLTGAGDAFLEWGAGDVVHRFPVRILAVLDPVPVLQIGYLAEPIRTNRRSQWRARAYILGRFRVGWPEVAHQVMPGLNAQAWVATMTRNVSYAAARFWAPEAFLVETPITVEWQPAQGSAITGTMAIVRAYGESWYRGIAGRDVVARWDPPLAQAMAARWQQLCDEHHDG